MKHIKNLLGVIKDRKSNKKTLITNFDKGGLKDVDIPSKINTLQMLKSCLIQIFMNGNLSLFFLLKTISEKKIKFHGSLDIPQYLI